jgi:hypothetical protein
MMRPSLTFRKKTPMTRARMITNPKEINPLV